MRLRFVGKDPESGAHGCPAVWVDEATNDLVIQGVTADASTIALTVRDSPLPAHESVVRLPQRMIPLLKEAVRDTEPQ
ncbi:MULTISPECIES: hypothetical protein [Streptomyces]|uniref:Uncharacterized protein n=1 Tax=Streptomyces globisporus TaxID=1908 RepID=A0A927BLA1_STRGL|nr:MULTISPECIES: hypothetical protein [Streptomyces]MBD2829299.1 hypothetical protein [Streptomyces globisporus]MYW77206.1 hypothetical protein [Streptomyces sp. SID8369]NEA10155.1 hypothetical protein [Streptomyces sp. SID10692]NEC40768.1 hypothetical protein [Streptomyces sp. SID8016]KOG77378.1 hypothetical protein ADK33_31100 [Streptomyces griseus subsp. rhodochrous]